MSCELCATDEEGMYCCVDGRRYGPCEWEGGCSGCCVSYGPCECECHGIVEYEPLV